VSGRESEASSAVEPEIGTRQGQGNLPEKDPSNLIGSGEILRDSHYQVSQLRPRVRAHEGYLSVERPADGRWRRNRFRGGERNFPKARLGESSARITARGDTMRLRQRFGKIHRPR